MTLTHSEAVFVKKRILPRSIWDLRGASPSAIIKIMSSAAILELMVLIGQCFIFGVVSIVATLEWRVLIGQCFVIGTVSSVAILK